MKNLIEIQNLEFGYTGNELGEPVLKNINLNIKKGEFVSVVGPNGCGKSTLVRHLNGLLVPSMGSVKINGFATDNPENLAIIRRIVGMVFQNPDTQLFASVVEEDVAFGVENMCLPRSEIRSRVDKALAKVGMSEYRNHPPHRLSGGQKQKVAIAGVLAMEPECIVMDEPTSMLDPKGRTEVMEAVLDLNLSYGITVIYVTHDMAETLYSSRLLALNGGEVTFDGFPGDFFESPVFPEAAGVMVPPIRELINRLVSRGFSLTSNIKSPEELVEAICRLNCKI